MLQAQKEYIDFLSLCKDSIEKTGIEIKGVNDDSEAELFNSTDTTNTGAKKV